MHTSASQPVTENLLVLQVRAARRLAQGRAKPVDWLVQDLYGIAEDEDAAEEARRNDEAADSEEEREQLRLQVEGNDWTQGMRRSFRSEKPAGFARPRGLAAEPYQVMFGLMPEDLQELHDEIKGYQELESRVTPLNAEYWGCLLTLAGHELEACKLVHEAERQGLHMEQQPGVRAVGAPLPRVEGSAGVHSAVQQQVELLLSGQTYSQLTSMEADIQRQLAAGEGDPEYWEAVLPRLRIHAAKARLREIKAQMLEERLAAQEEKLDVAAAMGWLDDEEQEMDDNERHLGEDGVPLPQGAARIVAEGDVPLSDDDPEQPQQAVSPQQPKKQLHPDEEMEQQLAADEQQQGEQEEEPEPREPVDQAGASAAGRLSPPPVDPAELVGGDFDVINEEEDRRMIELLRAQVRIKEAEKFMSAAEIAASHSAAAAPERAYHNQLLDPRNRFRGTHPMMRNLTADALETGVGRLGPGKQEEQLDDQTRRFREQALKAMGVDEGDRNFGCEVPIEAQAYWWHNRYAPRKPRYFNRIHTGYEWNKYNQTHYDTENPPPKVVQGYKFNIFYPDLIDRTKAPTYRVEPDPNGSRDTCILAFSAGPPYEDIAFRIVNKEWETTHRRGFKCTFDRGILHLYFNFKRARYRR
eukprot:GHUV01025659.1.p1 GENE.GHUV01025659.1~~GHUV01025659.1.p1  ORF type:complete len:639 (+),score=216.86 GHUV01025659.1:228-2144(+)